MTIPTKQGLLHGVWDGRKSGDEVGNDRIRTKEWGGLLAHVGSKGVFNGLLAKKIGSAIWVGRRQT